MNNIFLTIFTTFFIGVSLNFSTLNAQENKTILTPNARLGLVSDWTIKPKMFSRFVEIYILACAGRKDVEVFHIDRHFEALFCMGKRLDKEMFWIDPTVMVLINSGLCDITREPISEKRKSDCAKSLNEIIDTCESFEIDEFVIGWPAYAADLDLRKDADQKNKNLEVLRDIAIDVTKEKNVRYADFFKSLHDVLMKTKGGEGLKNALNWGARSNTPDFNIRGNLVLAYTLLKTFGFDGEIGTFTVDMKGKATASSDHKIVKSSNGEIEIESMRYPFCLDRNLRLLLPYLPFNEDLNRLILKVYNVTTPKVRVTWGGESRDFSAEQLKEGINLPAEFTKTPFDEPFKKLMELILKKEEFEVEPGMFRKKMSKSPLLSQIKDKTAAKQAFEDINVGLRKRWFEHYQDILKDYKPVKHTITITPIL